MKTIYIVLIAALVVIVAVVLFVPGILTTLFSVGETVLCDDEPYVYNCVCKEGFVKQGRYPWSCVELPEPPSEITFPIETWGEARAYSMSLLGGFPCTGEYAYDNILTGEIFKQCSKYGGVFSSTELGKGKVYLGNIVMVECRQFETIDDEGKPTGGHIVFSVRFDPNDGHVYKVSCNDEFIDCTDVTIVTDNPKEDPQSVCGDSVEGLLNEGFCCHYPETFENCPEDCIDTSIKPEDCCGDSVCDKNRKQTVTCIATGETMWTSDCNGIIRFDVDCEGNSAARIDYETETIENCPEDCA